MVACRATAATRDAAGGRTLALETLAQLGEFVSGVVVVVSLIYLAYQVRQNTRSLRTENYARALDRVANIQARLSADPSLASVFNRGVVQPEALSPAERIQFTWAFYEMFGAFEFMFHQSQARALEDEVWQRWSATMAWWISLPGVQVWWRSRPTPFSDSFTRYVEELVGPGAPDAAAAQRWVAFLSGAAPARPGSGGVA